MLSGQGSSRALEAHRSVKAAGNAADILLFDNHWSVFSRYNTDNAPAPRTPLVESGLDFVIQRQNGSHPLVKTGAHSFETKACASNGGKTRNTIQQRQAEAELGQLYAKLELRARQLNALYEIGRTLAATLDLHEIYWVMYREIAQVLLDAAHFTVALFDQAAETIYYNFAIVDGKEIDSTTLPAIPLGDDPMSHTIRSREPCIVDLQETFPDLVEHGRATMSGVARVPRSALYMPMIGGDRVVGVMNVQHDVADVFHETDMPLLSTLANQAAMAITNARLYAQEQERADALAHALKKQKDLDRLQNELLQNVSHELRTPLGIVYGYIELLNNGDLGELLPEQKDAVSIVTRRVHMLRNRVEDFTTILDSERTDQQPEPVCLTHLVQLLLDDLQISAQQAGLTLSVEIVPDLPPVFGYTSHLRQVVDNLVANALKYTPSGGAVALRLGREGMDVVLEVADNGIGIPHDQLERIFERFYQVDGSATRRYGGTGLGLALVKEVVQAHGGQVTVQSTLGEGSIFQVRLPAVNRT